MDGIFLIGYRGSGKTTVARLLAEKLGWQHIDADEYLERKYQRTIRQIFAEEGEAGFREKEAVVLAELSSLQAHVISTGGGIVLRPENRELLKTGFVIWLKAPASVLFERIQKDATTAERRPALTTGGLAEIEQLLAVREPLYEQCAHMAIDCTELSPEEVVSRALDKLPGVRS